MSDSSFGRPVDLACRCCGGRDYGHARVLWDELIREWDLSPEEVNDVDRQQGTRCLHCGNTLRAIALASAILSAVGFQGTFLQFLRSPRKFWVRILEINTANTLTTQLARLPRRTLVTYPEVDMLKLPFRDEHFDLVVHSDTLEHISDPVGGLKECRRVLKPGGFCCFTIPILIGRLTRSREGMPPSYHGSPNASSDYLVHTEYGSDFWKQVFDAGFDECRIVTAEFPSALAICARKGC